MTQDKVLTEDNFCMQKYYFNYTEMNLDGWMDGWMKPT